MPISRDMANFVLRTTTTTTTTTRPIILLLAHARGVNIIIETSLSAQHFVEEESAGSMTRTIHAVDELHQVVQWHYCLYAQERCAGIYCVVSNVTMYF